MGDVVVLDCDTRLDIPPDRVLEGALGELTQVVIIGYDAEGEEYFASSTADVRTMLWLLERAKASLLRD